MHFFLRYSHIWSFKSTKEKAYREFNRAVNQISLQIINLLIIVGMSFFIVVDFFRQVNYPIAVGFRSGQLTIALFVFYYSKRKALSASQIEWLTILTFIIQTVSGLGLALIGEMPSFFLTNVTVTILVFVTTISGLRFRYAFLFNTAYLIVFFLFSQLVKRDPFYFSQYANIFMIFIYSMIAGALIENRRRRAFLQYEELALQKRKVEELNQQKNKIISVLSHDVASPIHSLAGLLHLQESGQVKEAELKPFVKDIRKRLDNVSTLVFGLVRWSRSQLEGFIPERRVIDLSNLLNEIVELFRPVASEKSIQIILDAPGPFKIHCDEEMIRIAIRNLVSNAVKFSSPQKEIWIKIIREEDRIKTNVSNEGPPIRPETLKKLFGYQVGSSDGTSGEKGTGLGLAMAAYFIKVNGGKLYLDEQLINNRVSFTVDLPELI